MLIYKAGGPAHRAAGSRLHTTCETSQFWMPLTHASWHMAAAGTPEAGVVPPDYTSIYTVYSTE